MLLFAFFALALSQAVTIDLGAALEAFMTGTTPAFSTGFGPSMALGLYAANYALVGGALTGVTLLSAVSNEAGANTGTPFTPSFVGWYNPNSQLVPAIMANSGAAAPFGNSASILPTPANDLFMHAGNSGSSPGNAVIYRWTAPQAGTVSFPTSISFTQADSAGLGAITYVVRIGGTSYTTINTGAQGFTVSYAAIPDATVTATETVEFIVAVSPGSNANTGVNLHAVFLFTPTSSGTE
jgi:hypothetical protein